MHVYQDTKSPRISRVLYSSFPSGESVTCPHSVCLQFADKTGLCEGKVCLTSWLLLPITFLPLQLGNVTHQLPCHHENMTTHHCEAFMLTRPREKKSSCLASYSSHVLSCILLSSHNSPVSQLQPPSSIRHSCLNSKQPQPCLQTFRPATPSETFPGAKTGPGPTWTQGYHRSSLIVGGFVGDWPACFAYRGTRSV
jgi:hypothetical protein